MTISSRRTELTREKLAEMRLVSVVAPDLVVVSEEETEVAILFPETDVLVQGESSKETDLRFRAGVSSRVARDQSEEIKDLVGLAYKG